MLDSYVLRKPDGQFTLTLMTQAPPEITSGAVLIPLRNSKVRVLHDAALFAAKSEEVKITDSRLGPIWGERVYRVLLTAAKALQKGESLLRITQA